MKFSARRMLIAGITVTLLAVAGYQLHHYRAVAIAAHPMLPVNFEHRDHSEVSCTQCHHDFIDDSGSGTCYACHKFRSDLAPRMEEMFHQLCRDCHLDTRVKGEDSGPLRSCARCHDPLSALNREPKGN